MYAWYNNGAEGLENAMLRDLDDAAGLIGSADHAAVQTACDSLRDDVEAYRAYGPSPDSRHEAHLAVALAQLARGATDCTAGISTDSGELIATARAELDASFGEIGRATARLKAINSN